MCGTTVVVDRDGGRVCVGVRVPCRLVQRQPADGTLGAAAGVEELGGSGAAAAGTGATPKGNRSFTPDALAHCGEGERNDGHTVSFVWQ